MLYVVFSTFPNGDQARRVAKILVEEGKAACVWVVPTLNSYYIWEGKLEEDSEALLVAKVPEERLEELVKRLKELHPYQVPEIVALKADYTLPEYLRWAREVCNVEG